MRHHAGSGGGNSRDNVLLVRTQGKVRIHAGNRDIIPVVSPRLDIIEQRIEAVLDDLDSIFIRHYPIVERLFDFVLAFTRKNGFLCVEYPFRSAVRKLPVIIHDSALLVQQKLRQLVCVEPFCAVGFSGKHVRHSA